MEVPVLTVGDKAPFARTAVELLGRAHHREMIEKVRHVYPIHRHYLDASEKCYGTRYVEECLQNGRSYDLSLSGWKGGVACGTCVISPSAREQKKNCSAGTKISTLRTRR